MECSKYKFFCDLEFTNSDPMRGQIIECAVLATDSNLNILAQYHQKIRPEIINTTTWQIEAQAVHRVTPADAMLHPVSRREFLFELLWFLKPFYEDTREPQEFICHALAERLPDKKTGRMSWPHIDFYMLEWAFRDENLLSSFLKIFNYKKIVSTITMAKETGLAGKNPKTGRPSYKLNLLCELIGFDLQHHKAMSDVIGCYEIYKYCVNNYRF